MLPVTPIVKKLIFVNCGLFLAQNLVGMDLVDGLGLRYVASSYFHPYQFFTHLFVHANFSHLFWNMFSLYTFGPTLENVFSSRRFFLFYVSTGLGASILYAMTQYWTMEKLTVLYDAYLNCPTPENLLTYFSQFPQKTTSSFYHFIQDFLENPNSTAYIAKGKSLAHQLYILKMDSPTVGASGAIFGIFTAFAILFPNTTMFLLFFPIPIKAKYLIVLCGVYELYTGVQANPADNVAHFAHLGGILIAYLFIQWWKRTHWT